MTTKVRIENPEGPDALQVSKYENNAFRPVVILESGDAFEEYAVKGSAFKVEEIPTRQTRVRADDEPVVTEDRFPTPPEKYGIGEAPPDDQEPVLVTASDPRTEPEKSSDTIPEDLSEPNPGLPEVSVEDKLTPEEETRVGAAIEISEAQERETVEYGIEDVGSVEDILSAGDEDDKGPSVQ